MTISSNPYQSERVCSINEPFSNNSPNRNSSFSLYESADQNDGGDSNLFGRVTYSKKTSSSSKLKTITFTPAPYQNESTKKVNIFEALSYKDKQHLSAFFEDFLLDSHGVYTLFGDKPMSMESLYYKDRSDFIENGYLYDDFEIVEDGDQNLTKHWKEIKKLFKNSQFDNFIIAEIKLDHYSNKDALLVFMNIENSHQILIKYYSVFKSIVGSDFQPMEVIEKLKKGDDYFWKKVLDNHLLRGLLLGYGYQNSFAFEWVMKKVDENSKNYQQFNAVKKETAISEPNYLINQRLLSLPNFVHFSESESDELILEYSNQRKKIVSLYKNNNFLSITLRRLASKI